MAAPWRHRPRTPLCPSAEGVPRNGGSPFKGERFRGKPAGRGYNTPMIEDCSLFRVGEEHPKGRRGSNIPMSRDGGYFFHTGMMKLLFLTHLYLVGMCNAFTFVSRGNIKNGVGGESGGSARFPHSERGFSGVKPRCEKFHKKTIFCGQIVIDNNILLWYDCRAFFGEDDNFRPELP